MLSVVIISSACSRKKDEAIKIGVILPLTGDLAQPGVQSFQGIQLAIEQYNDSTSRATIKIIAEDSRGLPAEGISGFKKLTSVDGVKLIIGDLISGVTLAIAPLAEKEQVVILAPGASNPKVRDAGDYIFRNWASDNFDGAMMAHYLINRKKIKRCAVIYVNNDYGLGLGKRFVETFESSGGGVAIFEGYDQGATDFRTLLNKLKNIEIDYLYLPGQPIENGLLIRQLTEAGIHVEISANLSVESPDFLKIAGSAAKGIIFSTPAFDIQSSERLVLNFVSDYNNRFGMMPDVVAGHGFDAANIMIMALNEANYNIDQVKSKLYQINDFPGVTGKTTFDEMGDVIKPVMIKRLNADGSSVVIEKFVP